MMRRPRSLLLVLLVAAGCVLGVLQIFSSIAVRAQARPEAWMRHVPPGALDALDSMSERIPLPATLRWVLAREALARGDLAQSEMQAARLGPSSDRLALTGDLAQARGDVRGAVRDFLAAGDVDGLEERVAALVARGDIAAALRLQTAAIERLRGDRTQGAALARAYYELGLLQQTQAYRFAVGAPVRRANAQLSERAYARAVAIAPLDERYLLALGYQQVNLGELGAAERTFARAREADPASAAAYTGLGEIALRRGDRRTSRDYLARARARDAASDAVRRLAAELGV